MSSRIAPAEPPYPESVRRVLEQLMPSGMDPLLLFRVLARDERLFARFSGGGLLDRGHLTIRQREIVILRVCANFGSEYEWGVHVAVFAAKAGLTPEQIEATKSGAADSAVWSDPERVLLHVCDALATSTDLSAALWDPFRSAYSDEAILEILLLTGFYRTVSTLTNTLRLTPESWAARFPGPDRSPSPGTEEPRPAS